MDDRLYAHIPVAVLSLLTTCTVILNDDGLLRTSTSCPNPQSSSNSLKDVSLKDTVTSTYIKIGSLYS